jgi:NAD(P)-dependent dehydrogenase (short-subunit alcohol dehydrogenase family)
VSASWSLYEELEGLIFVTRAQEMAGTAIYLASEAGSYTNGQEIVIDGGYVAVNPALV